MCSGAVCFQTVEKNCPKSPKIIVHGGIFLKSFLESVSFHREMFGVTNFGLVLHICIVNAMIFVKTNIGKLVHDQF